MNPVAQMVPAVSRPRVPKEPIYQTPAVAWPTLGLFMLAIVLWVSALWGALHGLLPPALAILLQAAATFMQFTVLHDGVHSSLMRRYPRLNDFIASCAGAFLGPVASCAAFRHVHFAHHRHTNDRENDPDLWSGVSKWSWGLPLQWATADFYYAYRVFRGWADIAPEVRRKILGFSFLTTALFALSCYLGFGMEALLYWIVPSRFAILWLAFAFNFLPHHPHQVLQSHNPYAATNARIGGEPVMKWLFLYQNYHIIHHLFPSVPFYRYLKIWQSKRDEFKRLGTPEVAWHSVLER
ncbi:MAG: fatty acid desaturase family protein [Nevskiales bacterium]